MRRPVLLATLAGLLLAGCIEPPTETDPTPPTIEETPEPRPSYRLAMTSASAYIDNETSFDTKTYTAVGQDSSWKWSELALTIDKQVLTYETGSVAQSGRYCVITTGSACGPQPIHFEQGQQIRLFHDDMHRKEFAVYDAVAGVRFFSLTIS